MSAERDVDKFAALIDALGPYLDRVVIIGGWAHRLFRNHPSARPPPYAPLMTGDTDVAVPGRLRLDKESLRERLLSRDFREKFVGDDRPPVTHYQLGESERGFYAEFLTPLVGSELRRRARTRDQRRNVTTTVAGIVAQKLRYLDVLLIAPWSVPFDFGAIDRRSHTRVLVANPVSYIIQKLLITGGRKPNERAKDLLYIHDTLELFGASLAELRGNWNENVRPALPLGVEAKVRQARARVLAEVTDTVREAARMATGRVLSPAGLLEMCQTGVRGILESDEAQSP